MAPRILHRIDQVDRSISGRLVARPGHGLDRTAVALLHRVSQTGSYGAGWVLAFAVIVTLVESALMAALAAGCVMGTLLVNTAIKLMLRRPRPFYNPVGEQPRTYSLPSAHTSMAVVGAWTMGVFTPEFALAWWGWAAVLAMSRIVLGMHYVGDVLGGVALGLLLAYLAVDPLLVAAGVGT